MPPPISPEHIVFALHTVDFDAFSCEAWFVHRFCSGLPRTHGKGFCKLTVRRMEGKPSRFSVDSEHIRNLTVLQTGCSFGKRRGGCSASANHASPLPLPLGEVAGRSEDGEGWDDVARLYNAARKRFGFLLRGGAAGRGGQKLRREKDC